MIENLGERLRELRLKHRLKQSEVANAIHVTGALISAFEKKERTPSLEVLVRLCGFYHVSADYLLGIKTQNTLNLDGLSDEETEAVQIIIQSLKGKGCQ